MMSLNEILASFNIYLYFEDLGSVKGLTFKNNDSYQVIINDSLCDEMKTDTVLHELSHIELGHLDDNKHLSSSIMELQVIKNMDRIKSFHK